MLRPPFHVRAQSAVAPPGSVTIRSGAGDFIDAIARGFSDVAVVDPMLVKRNRAIAESLSRAHLGTVLYIELTPEYAQSSIELIRELGTGEIVTYGYNDDPTTFAGILRRQSRANRGLLLMRALAPQIALLSGELRRGIRNITDNGHRVDSVERLATLCGVTRVTLCRNFRKAGITSALGFVVGLVLLRNYDLLIDSSLTILDVARAAGFRSGRSLQHQIGKSTGLTLQAIRKPVSIDYLTECIAATLTTPQP